MVEEGDYPDFYNEINHILFSKNGIRITDSTLVWASSYIENYKSQLGLLKPTLLAENCKLCEYLQNISTVGNEKMMDSYIFPTLRNLGQSLPMNITSLILIAAKLCEFHLKIFGNADDIIIYLEPMHLLHHFFLSSCSENNFVHNTMVSMFNEIVNVFQFCKKSNGGEFSLPKTVLCNICQKWGYLNKKNKCDGKRCIYQNRECVNDFSDAKTLELLQNEDFELPNHSCGAHTSKNNCILSLLDTNESPQNTGKGKNQKKNCDLRSNIIYETKMLSKLIRLIESNIY